CSTDLLGPVRLRIRRHNDHLKAHARSPLPFSASPLCLLYHSIAVPARVAVFPLASLIRNTAQWWPQTRDSQSKHSGAPVSGSVILVQRAQGCSRERGAGTGGRQAHCISAWWRLASPCFWPPHQPGCVPNKTPPTPSASATVTSAAWSPAPRGQKPGSG